MTSTNTETQLKPSVELLKSGIEKLETFFKIASTKEETCFMEIDPQDNIIRLNSIDVSHITNTIFAMENKDNFSIVGLDKILQFNVNVKDFNKLLSLHGDKDLKIIFDLDENNNFDMIIIEVSENNVKLKSIYLPIHEVTHAEMFEQTVNLVKSILGMNRCVTIDIELPFFSEILKESEIFQNERLRFNVTLADQSIQNLSVETFDTETDKTRRMKTNLFQGLHFDSSKVNNKEGGIRLFTSLVSFADLKKLIVASKYYTHLRIVLAFETPLGLIYGSEDSFDTDSSLTTLLAPIVRQWEENDHQNQNEGLE